MAGKLNINWRIAAIIVALLLGLFVAWSFAKGWAPSRDDYEVQGIVVGKDNGKPNWAALGATGVDFAYLTATIGANDRDPSFQANMEGAQQSGIRYGALHHFDICRLASDQANLFITTVPRNTSALPPAVQLDFSDTCKGRPNRGLILAELSTFLSTIEVHAGVPALLMLDPAFEKEYQISKSIDRNVWLESNWFLPDYSARPWVMWTANKSRNIDGVEGAVRWAVVRD
jgi:lysozyme